MPACVYTRAVLAILVQTARREFACCTSLGECSTTHTRRMEENLAALDFDLESDEMQEIEQLEIGKSLFGWW
ncbi:MAG: hypothetical protein HDR12_11580 [Lachnospiraceae bacterium]|nr:hypothetical protein [Lachnospiraceae bacterium]